MGYKSFARAMGSAASAANRESVRRKKAQTRTEERMEKKIGKIEEKNEKIVDALQDEYAKGKIGKDEYEKLLARKVDITLELIVFGGTPASSLSKRYITGKIDKAEFDRMKEEVLPSEVVAEKKSMVQRFLDQANELEKFVKESNKNEKENCQHCNKQKGFFSSIKLVDSLRLCSHCSQRMKSLKEFTGSTGSFFEMKPTTIEVSEIEHLMPILGIKRECLL